MCVCDFCSRIFLAMNHTDHRRKRREVDGDRGDATFYAACGTTLLVTSIILFGFAITMIVVPGSVGHRFDHHRRIGNGTSDETLTRGLRSRVSVDGYGVAEGDRLRSWSRRYSERLGPAPGEPCSRECRCSHAGLVPYGRWCGYGYTGCDDSAPCDSLDACCMAHDRCVGERGLMACECHAALSVCAACAAVRRGDDPGYRTWCPTEREAAENVVASMEYLFSRCIETDIRKNAPV